MKNTYQSVKIEIYALDTADIITSSVDSNEDVKDDIWG